MIGPVLTQFQPGHRLPGSNQLFNNSKLAHAVWINQYPKVGLLSVKSTVER